jgi:hypothetical protein
LRNNNRKKGGADKFIFPDTDQPGDPKISNNTKNQTVRGTSESASGDDKYIERAEHKEESEKIGFFVKLGRVTI